MLQVIDFDRGPLVVEASSVIAEDSLDNYVAAFVEEYHNSKQEAYFHTFVVEASLACYQDSAVVVACNCKVVGA